MIKKNTTQKSLIPIDKVSMSPNLIRNIPDEWDIVPKQYDKKPVSANTIRRYSAIEKKMGNAVKKKFYLYTEMPMKCKGTDCTYGGCEHFSDNSCEIGEPCINEITYLVSVAENLYKATGIEIDDKGEISTDLVVDAMLVKDLVYNYLLLHRTEAALSRAELVSIDLFNVVETKSGNEYEIYMQSMNKLVDVYNITHKRIIEIERELQLTRKSKTDGEQNINVLAVLGEVIERSGKLKKNEYGANEYGVIDADSYTVEDITDATITSVNDVNVSM